jgi:hypothetical protein
MIEAPRRHGHFDPRWHTNGLSSRDREDDRPPMIRTAGNADARVSHDVGRSPRQRPAPCPQSPLTTVPLFTAGRTTEAATR